jgi:hypothetical protein
LARALQLSLAEQSGGQVLSQEDEDAMLARALAASEREARRQGITTNSSSSQQRNCQVS